MPKKKTVKRKRSKGIDWNRLISTEHARLNDQQRQLEFDYFKKENTDMPRTSTKSTARKSKKSVTTGKSKPRASGRVSKNTKAVGRPVGRKKAA